MRPSHLQQQQSQQPRGSGTSGGIGRFGRRSSLLYRPGGGAAAAVAANSSNPSPPPSAKGNDPRGSDEEGENGPSSMEEITNIGGAIVGMRKPQKTPPATANTMMENHNSAPPQPRSFGHELKGHSNMLETAAAGTVTTTLSDEPEATYHTPEDATPKDRTFAARGSKRMSMMTTTTTTTNTNAATSSHPAPPAADRRMSLSSSYRRPGNVAKPTSSGAGPPKTPYLQHLQRSHHLTPVRISTKVVEDADVQATNDGYASVAKLSAWLADDPTKAKQRVKQIRRGANVIAKSRKFDKELANVKIIEADALCRRGHVREKQHWLIEQQQLASMGSADDDAASISAASHRTASTTYGGLETSSAVSVQDKKEWLASAFQPPKGRAAMTDVGAAREDDDVEEVTSRAKQMWRQRACPAVAPLPSQASGRDLKTSAPSTAAEGPGTSAAIATPTGSDDGELSTQFHVSVSVTSLPITSIEIGLVASAPNNEDVTGNDLDDAMSLLSLDQTTKDAPEMKTSNAGPGASAQRNVVPRSPPPSTPHKLEPSCADRTEPSPAQSARLLELQTIRSSAVVRKTADVFARKDPAPEPALDESEDDKALSFQAARELLISRSKQNGNALEVVSKVSRRKAVFEKMQKDNRRKSLGYGHLKPSWKPEETVASSGASAVHKYKKTFVSDAAPKKSFEDLP